MRYIYIIGKNICEKLGIPEVMKSLELNYDYLADANMVLDIKDGKIIKNRCGCIEDIGNIDELIDWRNKAYNSLSNTGKWIYNEMVAQDKTKKEENKKWDRSKIYDGMFEQNNKENDNYFCRTCTFYKKLGKKACECCDYDKIFHDKNKDKIIDVKQMEESHKYTMESEKNTVTFVEKNKFNIDDILIGKISNKKYKIIDYAFQAHNLYAYCITSTEYDDNNYWYKEEDLLENFNLKKKETKYKLNDRILLFDYPHIWKIVEINPDKRKQYIAMRMYQGYGDIHCDRLYVENDDIREKIEENKKEGKKLKYKLLDKVFLKSDYIETYEIVGTDAFGTNTCNGCDYALRIFDENDATRVEPYEIYYFDENAILGLVEECLKIQKIKMLKYNVGDKVRLIGVFLAENYEIIGVNPTKLLNICDGKDYTLRIFNDFERKMEICYVNENEIMGKIEELNKTIYNQFHHDQIICFKNNPDKYKILDVKLDKDFIYRLENINTKEIRYETEEFLFLNVMFSS